VRVLFATTGDAGHLLPLLPFAQAAQAAGHEVRVATQRSRAEAVQAAGLTPWPFDDPPAAEWGPVMGSFAALSIDEANVRMVQEVFGRIDTRAALPGMRAAVAEWRPDLIVREQSEFASVLAAEHHQVPLARVALGLEASERWLAGLAAGAVDELRAQAGLPPDPAGAALLRGALLTLTPSALEDPAGPTGPDTHRFRAAAGPPGAPDPWPQGDDPPVYLSFGSVAARLGFFPALYAAAIEALAALPVRLLVTTGLGGDPAALGQVPANVRAERWIDQAAVTAHAAAMVGHGGYGSTLGALADGVPLVLVPLFAGDQWANARRVAEVGAGLLVQDAAGSGRGGMAPPAPEAFDELPRAVARVLDEPAFASTARAIAGEIAALPEVGAAVGVLEALPARAG